MPSRQLVLHDTTEFTYQREDDPYLARNSGPPPGNKTVWRGLTRLVDIQLGVCIGAEFMGN